MAQTASDVVRGIGVLTTFWKKVENAIREAGGTDEHIARLGKKDADAAIKEFAALIVNAATQAIAFCDQITSGGYDYLYGFARNPAEIRGQEFQPTSGETEIDHPGKYLTTKQVYEMYVDRMASLSELLDFGIKNPDVQRQFPIVIVWQDETGQFWYALLDRSGPGRNLDVHRRDPGGKWDDSYRFLVRK